jgi:hypothetical protein
MEAHGAWPGVSGQFLITLKTSAELVQVAVPELFDPIGVTL